MGNSRIEVEVESRWCTDCGTRHVEGAGCPGNPAPTGDERTAWRGVYRTPHGGEAHVVLVAPAGPRWLARVVTEPRAIWTIPGHPKPMRFVGDTADDAAARAIGHVRAHCESLGHRPIEELPANVVVDVVTARPERRRVEAHPSSRKAMSMAVLWGFDEPVETADTANVSEGGMFLITSTPPEPGVTVKLRVAVDGCTMPLSGRVVWSRPQPEADLPPGMGIQLVRPPAIFSRFVRSLG